MSKTTVGLVLVSHSRALAEATRALATQMTGDAVVVECAAGVGEAGEALGTDAMAIVAALERAAGAKGVVVLMDLGSALLSAETALDLVDTSIAAKTRLSAGPFVEGAVAAAVRAAGGGTLDEVAAEARRGLVAKEEQLGEAMPAPAPVSVEESTENVFLEDAILGDEHGLHARPAARLVSCAAQFDAKVAIENRTNGKGPRAADSIVLLAGLQAGRGDVLRIAASGRQAEAAVRAMAALVRTFGATPDAPPPPAPETATNERGIPIAPGVAVGPCVRLERAEIRFSHAFPKDPPAELGRLTAALDEVEAEIRSAFGRDDMATLHATLLRDPVILQAARELITNQHQHAAAAFHEGIERAALALANADDPYMRARIADLRDVELAVLRALGAAPAAVLPEGPPALLLADELLPSEAARLDPTRVLGVVDLRGGPTSHAAILLRGAGIPAVFGAASMLKNLPASPARLGLDGSTGEVWVDPPPDLTADLERRRAEERAARRSVAALQGKVPLPSGPTVELWANAASALEARAAKEAGAFGIGLLRTEMFFLDRGDAPGEDEQADLYAEVLAAFPGAPVVIRTLDAGGDKRLPWLHVPPEENPYLGLRGIRLSLDRPDLLETQLRAILRAGRGRDVRLMIPMVSTATEIEATKAALARAARTLDAAGKPYLWPVPLGIMVEVPAAALLADRLAPHVDFFSIGTNDLTQYTLAAERGHPRLAALADAGHPAVLDLVDRVSKAGLAAGRAVSVCGEAAADPKLAATFVGLGITRLSMGPAAIARVAAALVAGAAEIG
ncbi:phosphoenolpyruvate--protein phosphotransferase [Polyangium sorediatum]|uniref:Phosphoenolpyruvate--protein phosphotransferase n=1 Tax=Polyangium sorediatum TaxID=889274 RepID=A0ABT6P371_9BACT|nr:phosphoenolpyruvate--protein phosphotransferase [Polyangium sorediatum]MDI1435045.1 phosphoenolpyruvate--protein phosphotransferase [Polyangium sorediatum]